MENKYIKKARKVLEKNKHYEFFKTYLYDFSAINSYKGFEHLDFFLIKNYMIVTINLILVLLIRVGL